MLMKTPFQSVETWERWFAWRPVTAFTGNPDRPFRRVWLAAALRRRHRRGHWQYRTTDAAFQELE